MQEELDSVNRGGADTLSMRHVTTRQLCSHVALLTAVPLLKALGLLRAGLSGFLAQTSPADPGMCCGWKLRIENHAAALLKLSRPLAPPLPVGCEVEIWDVPDRRTGRITRHTDGSHIV